MRSTAPEVKIGADELPAVTQLFTEPYMVEFLLHNTLGAWWAGKTLAAKRRWPTTPRRKTNSAPSSRCRGGSLYQGYSASSGWRGRQVESVASAAGTFDGWPKTAAELKILDPCCGSGHFLVAFLHHLVPIRMAEEGLSAAEAVDAVLRDNLHGLEIDERCCQIAAFALAFAAWTYPEAGGYRPLPELHIACTGIGPQSTGLAEQSGIPMPARRARADHERPAEPCHRLFSQGAPTLGSLINPADLLGTSSPPTMRRSGPTWRRLKARKKADDEARERAIAVA